MAGWLLYISATLDEKCARTISGNLEGDAKTYRRAEAQKSEMGGIVEEERRDGGKKTDYRQSNKA